MPEVREINLKRQTREIIHQPCSFKGSSQVVALVSRNGEGQVVDLEEDKYRSLLTAADLGRLFLFGGAGRNSGKLVRVSDLTKDPFNYNKRKQN